MDKYEKFIDKLNDNVNLLIEQVIEGGSTEEKNKTIELVFFMGAFSIFSALIKLEDIMDYDPNIIAQSLQNKIIQIDLELNKLNQKDKP